MDYYGCPKDELRQELLRRGYQPQGGRDELSECLTRDDVARSSEATTLETMIRPYREHDQGRRQTAEYGDAVDPSLLVGERIVHWTLNTFFPTLHLFFESGLSCTIEGGKLRNAKIGLDYDLRFRLENSTHEEEGVLVKSLCAEKFASHAASIGILEAVIARRISVEVTPCSGPEVNHLLIPAGTRSFIEEDEHLVVGLRLQGMKKLAYVWAKADLSCARNPSEVWGDVRIAGLRDDIPMPFLGFPRDPIKPGGNALVVTKKSLISAKARKRDPELGSQDLDCQELGSQSDDDLGLCTELDHGPLKPTSLSEKPNGEHLRASRGWVG
ncbi:hypothetical protein BDV95DRAFT_498177 [Massariosphaeria phaeospora]|uniref:SAP domain-containing protein n=1 Tax=Massariosphaeria phaeospora TaxID=100035 RepID=A0A7C8I6N1_9PLEO|nr:hypothetical protein BDV95DRAFT_498177 [Massariosphaeria phaeospora]